MNIKNQIKNKFCLLALATLGACTTYSQAPVKDPQLVATPDSVSVRLAQAADRASRSLEALAAVEQHREPSVQIASVPNAPQELKRAITVEWYGPAEQIINDVAARASYTFQIFGDTPPTPIIVSLTARNRQVIDVLRDLGLQMGTKADLRVDANRRTIELYYPSSRESQRLKG